MISKGNFYTKKTFLQDANQTWYTEEPDFTSCFQKTVLLWMPCAFLIVFAPIRVYLLHQEDSSSLKLSKLNIAKTVSKA